MVIDDFKVLHEYVTQDYDSINIKSFDKMSIIFFTIKIIQNKPYTQFLFASPGGEDIYLSFESVNMNTLTIEKSHIKNMVESFSVKTSKYNVFDFIFKGIFVFNDELYCLSEYNKKTKYFELDYFKDNKFIECSAFDIINMKKCEKYRIDKNITSLFINKPDIYRIQNIEYKYIYPVPITCYYGTKIKYINEIIFMGNESFRQESAATHCTDYELAKYNSRYYYELDENKIFINIQYPKSKHESLSIHKGQSLTFQNGKLYRDKTEVINIGKQYPILDNSHMKIENIDVLTQSCNISFNKKYAVRDSSLFNNFYRRSLSSSNQVLIKYNVFIDEHKFIGKENIPQNTKMNLYSSYDGNFHSLIYDLSDLNIISLIII